MDADVGTSTKD